MQFKDVVYGRRYRVTKGFFRDSIGIALDTTVGVTPPKVKVRIVQTTDSAKELPPTLQTEAWLEPNELERA